MAGVESSLASGPSAELGRLLTRLRDERGLSQKQVALSARISNSTLSRLESGERGVSREVIDRISDVLKLDRHERLDILTAAGFLAQDTAVLLADDDLAQLARLLHADAIEPDDALLLRQYIRLALAHARALGYRLERFHPGSG